MEPLLAKPKIITDPIHKKIIIEHKLILDIIACKEFQRLHKLRQLGGSYVIFPSAKHSRYEHSLGVYSITRDIISRVVKDQLPEQEKLIVLLAALLHDIGHGPYSHTFNSFHHVDHEDYSINIIKDKSEINACLVAYNPTFPKRIAQILKKQHPLEFVNQIISSQVDADRMDYLLRDSYFSGLGYGTFDYDRIVSNMEIVNNKLVFLYKSLSAIENFFVGRFHINKQLYQHPLCMCFETMLTKIMKRISFLYDNDYPFKTDISLLKPLLSNKPLTNAQHFELNDENVSYIIEKLKQEKDEILNVLVTRFCSQKFFFYIKHKDPSYLNSILAKVNYPNKDYYTQLYQAKTKVYDGKDNQIQLLDYQNIFYELSTQSTIIQSLNNQVDLYYLFLLEEPTNVDYVACP
jgi:HD superfamily phosphohydrolase